VCMQRWMVFNSVAVWLDSYVFVSMFGWDFGERGMTREENVSKHACCADVFSYIR